ncbi:MAG: hypothetical protein Faunusvirus3_2 [Faunusvirus sp.]|jgi:hypothetical protein|uniref:Uncharacterized protein n=1 Tax=Faunusvirus sp. TaxID=2487766 RepID=A0A3G4ZW45_9VIRU|nr:MAG: hypothetical protein Faunusvirus3_2 [Faunusvirus sp.]
MQKNLISTSLEYYDRNAERYSKIFKKIGRVTYDIKPSDLDKSKIYLYDKSDKLILSAHFEYLGKYFSSYKLWTYSWSQPEYSKNLTYISRKILEYGLDIDSCKGDSLTQHVKTQLITSRIKIEDPLQLDIQIGLASYLSRQDAILPITLRINDNIPVSANNSYVNYHILYNIEFAGTTL